MGPERKLAEVTSGKVTFLSDLKRKKVGEEKGYFLLMVAIL